MKIAVHILFFNQTKWILKALSNCGPFVDKIYIAWSKNPWSYGKNSKNFKNNSDLEILKKSEFYHKIETITGEWKLDEEERNECLKRAKNDNMDYLITQDADEFYTFDGYKKLIESIKNNPDYDYYTTPWICFWKDFKHVLVAEDNNIINGYPEIAINLRKNIKFIRCRRPNSTNHKRLDSICYHMCFVFDKDEDEDCWDKINTWGHSNEFNIDKWYKEKWIKWKPSTENLHPTNPKAWAKAIEYTGILPEVLL